MENKTTKKEILDQIEILKKKAEALEGSNQSPNKERDEWFLSILKDLRVKEIASEYIEYGNSKGELMIQDGKKGTFWLNYDHIWSVFESKYGMKSIKIQQYTKDMLLMHLNWSVNTGYFNPYQKLFNCW